MSSTRKRQRSKRSDGVTYAGGDGGSLQDAVVIHGAATGLIGIRAEYRYLVSRFGPISSHWDLDHQALRHTPDGRSFDEMTIKLKDGTLKTVCFDVTEFFGKH